MALVEKGAALMVRDDEAKEKLISLAIKTVNDKEKLNSLHTNILQLALPDSADIIADEVIKLAKWK